MGDSVPGLLYFLDDHAVPINTNPDILLIVERKTIICRDLRGDGDIPSVACTDRDYASNTFLYHVFSIV